MEKTSGRSAQFPTHYRVGSVTDVFQVTRDVYWSPADGYGIERYYECLTTMPAEDVAKVEWFDKDGDLEKIVTDLRVSNGELAQAMVGDLYDHILDTLHDQKIAERAEWEKGVTLREDQDFAEDCEVEKETALRRGAGV